MKKLIIFLILLFIGVLVSNKNSSVKEIKKNDITSVAVCTNNYIITSNDVVNHDYCFVNTGSDVQYYLSVINNNISNYHFISCATNYYNLLGLIVNRLYLRKELFSIRFSEKAKTVGLRMIMNRLAFNTYLYHSQNKLGRT